MHIFCPEQHIILILLHNYACGVVRQGQNYAINCFSVTAISLSQNNYQLFNKHALDMR